MCGSETLFLVRNSRVKRARWRIPYFVLHRSRYFQPNALLQILQDITVKLLVKQSGHGEIALSRHNIMFPGEMLEALHTTHCQSMVNVSVADFSGLMQNFNVDSLFMSITKLQTTAYMWSGSHKFHNLWIKHNNITWHSASWRSLLALTYASSCVCCKCESLGSGSNLGFISYLKFIYILTPNASDNVFCDNHGQIASKEKEHGFLLFKSIYH